MRVWTIVRGSYRGEFRLLAQCIPLSLNARVASLVRYEKTNRKAEPQAAFLKVEPRATRPDSCPLPVTD